MFKKTVFKSYRVSKNVRKLIKIMKIGKVSTFSAVNLVLVQPDVRHHHGQVCGAGSDMLDVVQLCASSQHLTIP